MPTGTVKGTVKWFSPLKGFGFITTDEDEGDVFVHISAVEAAGSRHIPAVEAAGLGKLMASQKGEYELVRGYIVSGTESDTVESVLSEHAEEMLDDIIAGAEKVVERIDNTRAHIEKVRAKIAVLYGDKAAS